MVNKELERIRVCVNDYKEYMCAGPPPEIMAKCKGLDSEADAFKKELKDNYCEGPPPEVAENCNKMEAKTKKYKKDFAENYCDLPNGPPKVLIKTCQGIKTKLDTAQ